MKLRRGIRIRDRRFFVDLTVKGAGRRTATLDTLDEAKVVQAKMRLALAPRWGRACPGPNQEGLDDRASNREDAAYACA